jgi:hypothetical protein
VKTLISIEEVGMKALKIENSQGHFLTEEGKYETVDKIDKVILKMTLISMSTMKKT